MEQWGEAMCQGVCLMHSRNVEQREKALCLLPRAWPYARGAPCAKKIQRFVVFSRRVWGTKPIFNPNPAESMSINTRLSFTISHVELCGSRRRQSLGVSWRDLSSTFVLKICFIYFVICFLLPWVTKHLLIWVLRWNTICLLKFIDPSLLFGYDLRSI